MKPRRPIRIASRASALARAQAEWVAERLGEHAHLVWIRSGGDEDAKTALTRFDAPGIFTAALHRALLEDRADCAVHSLKDLPVEDDPRLPLICVPAREDPRDALVARDGLALAALPAGARVGTGSPRRAAQVLRLRPDLAVVPIRGNVDTRIGKVRSGDVDAVVLAYAGLRRLGREQEVTEVFDPTALLPAAGQGALGITARDGDAASEARLDPLRDVRGAATAMAERAALHALGAGCHAPVGALAELSDGTLHLRVRVCSLDGREMLEEEASGPVFGPDRVGAAAAEALLARGAAPLVAAR